MFTQKLKLLDISVLFKIYLVSMCVEIRFDYDAVKCCTNPIPPSILSSTHAVRYDKYSIIPSFYIKIIQF